MTDNECGEDARHQKDSVATSERSDNLPSPHTPWPLVQPFPSEVPNPTSSPATASNHPGKLRARDGNVAEESVVNAGPGHQSAKK